MGSSLRWIIKGELVLQAPTKYAKGQSQECKHPKEAEWPTFAPTIHSHRNPKLILDKSSATTQKRMQLVKSPTLILTQSRGEVAGIFLIRHKKSRLLMRICRDMRFTRLSGKR